MTLQEIIFFVGVGYVCFSVGFTTSFVIKTLWQWKNR